MKNEFHTLKANNTWMLVSRHPDDNIINNKLLNYDDEAHDMSN